MKRIFLMALVSIQCLVFIGCAGVQSYPNRVSAGETASVGIGWQKDLTADNMRVTITPTVGPQVTYEPNDPAIRALVNLYPDPVSYMVVGLETNQETPEFNFGATYGRLVNNIFTQGDKDWWQTTAFINMPSTIASGQATIEIASTADPLNPVSSSTVMIVDGGPQAEDDFEVPVLGGLTASQMSSMGRSPHVEVSFTSATIPHAIEVQLSHDPDLDNGGAGRLHVVNTRGDLKSMFWSDTGSQLKVILMPVGGNALSNINDFKFYVAGGMQNVAEISVQGFDVNGNDVTGVLTNLVARN